MAAHGPKSDTDPINLDAMDDAAREQFKDDPKTLRRDDEISARAQGLGRCVAAGSPRAARGHAVDLREPGREPRRHPAHAGVPRAAAARQQAAIADYVRQPRRSTTPTGSMPTKAAPTPATARPDDARAASAGRSTGNCPTRGPSTRCPKTALQMLRGDLGDEHVNRLLSEKRKLGASERQGARRHDR